MRSLLVATLLAALSTPALSTPALATPAAASPGTLPAGVATAPTSEPAGPAASMTPAPPSELETKSSSVAVLLSFGVTTGGALTLLAAGDDSPLALFGAGALYFGPSTGHWYAGEIGGLGLGLRALGAVSGFIGFGYLLDSETSCDFEDDCSAEEARADRAGRRATIFLATGATLWIGSTVADILLAKRAADRWNQRSGLAIAPTPIAARDGHVPGVALGGRF